MASILLVLCRMAQAAVARIQAEDAIVQIDNTSMSDTQSLGEALASHNPGDPIAVYIYRGSQHMTINAKHVELQAGSQVRSAGIGKTVSSREAGTSRMEAIGSFRPARSCLQAWLLWTYCPSIGSSVS